MPLGNIIWEVNFKNMKTKQKILVLITVITLLLLILVIINCLPNKKVNFCNQTMKQANEPINWHNGIYSPEGCDLTQYQIIQ